MMLGILVLELPRILLPGLPTDRLGMVLLAVLCVAAALEARRTTLLMVGGIAVTIVLLTLWNGNPWALVNGLRGGLLLACFVPALMMVRATADASPALAEARARFAAMPVGEAATGFMFGAFGCATVLTTSAHAVLAVLVPQDAALGLRRRLATAALRGGGMATLWSPFFVALAASGHYVPSVQAWQIIPLGFAMAALGLVTAMAVGGYSWRSLPRALAGLQPLVLPVSAAAVVVIAATLLLHVGTVQAVVLTMPPACLAWVLAAQRAAVRKVLHDTHAGMLRMGDEVLLITAAVTLGGALEATPELARLSTAWLAHVPSFAVLMLAPLTMILLGMVGWHPVVTSTVVLVALVGLPDRPPDLFLQMATLLGWGMTVICSPSGIQILVASTMFRVPFQQLVRNNFLFSLGFSVVGALVLGLLDALLELP